MVERNHHCNSESWLDLIHFELEFYLKIFLLEIKIQKLHDE